MERIDQTTVSKAHGKLVADLTNNEEHEHLSRNKLVFDLGALVQQILSLWWIN